jgi:NADPH:quinone reductase-like Zn-dependent oxidoreductase
MKAVVFNKYGENDVIDIRDIPLPICGPRDVLIKVRAASVNPVDWKVRYGQARVLTGSTFPKVLGCECAGEVAGAGSRATKFTKGDPVVMYAGVRRLGAFAEYACTAEERVYPIPSEIQFAHAACIPIAGLTAIQALKDHGRIKAGSKVLINGAAGGVGHFAVQIGKALGAQVTGVCSGRSVDLVRSLGADRVIDRQQQDFTGTGERYDIIFDAVSKRSFRECRKALTSSGIYVNTLPDATLVAQFFTNFLPGRKARSMWVRPSADDMAWMMAQLKTGGIKVVVAKVFPLDQAREALAYSETETARGKIVLAVSGTLHSGG